MNAQAKGMSVGFGALASICNGVAFVARQGHDVANGLRYVADGIDNVSTKVDTAMLQRAMNYKLKQQAMAEVANMSDEEIAQCAEAMEAEEVQEVKKVDPVQAQTIDEAKTKTKAESVGEVTNQATEQPKENPMKKAVNSKIAIESGDIPFAGNFAGEMAV